MIDVYVSGLTIDCGRQGENLARNIIFELQSLIDTYGEGTATLVYMRPTDTAPYICETTQDDAVLTWTPTSTDTAYAGSGKCELRWVVGETLAKSIVYNTTIAPSITGAGEVPSPYKSWYDAIIAYIEANYAANGAPQEVREAIYTLLSKATYTETGLTDELEVVRAWTAETISVTNNLTHVTNSNTATMAEQGGSYTGTLTADSGYVLGTVSVTMGGEDVTATVYSSGTITIPSVTGDIVITATAVPAVASLSAVYTQSGTVYDTDALDTLKADLVVTATYSDSTTATVPSSDYTLSGTLTEGTSTVTVSYGGKTATFDVTVSTHILFEVTNRAVDKTTACEDTGLEFLKTDHDFTILFDGTQANAIPSGYSQRLFFCASADTSWKGVFCGGGNNTNNYSAQWYGVSTANIGANRNSTNARMRIAYRHTAGSDKAVIATKLNSNSIVRSEPSYTFASNGNAHLFIGGASAGDTTANWVGTIARCTVYDNVLTDDEINTFLA